MQAYSGHLLVAEPLSWSRDFLEPLMSEHDSQQNIPKVSFKVIKQALLFGFCEMQIVLTSQRNE